MLSALLLWWLSSRDEPAGDALQLQGNVDIRQVSLAFDGSGRVQEVRVEEGDKVKAGDVLATLDIRTLQLQADQAKAQIESQRQTVARLHNGARPQEIVQARSQLAAAQADAARAAQDLQRLQGVASATDGRGVSAQEMDRARSVAKVAAATVELQQQALALVQRHNIRIAVLKANSPSCGNLLTYDGTFSGVKVNGEGVTASLLKRHGVQVFSERQLPEAAQALANIRSTVP